MSIKSYRDLIVWRKAMALAKEAYGIAGRLPASERFGLASQLRRAAVSVPSNIAEGQSRRNPREFRQFLFHALGSLAEVDTQIELTHELGYLRPGDTEVARGLVDELRRMSHTLAARLPERRRALRSAASGH